MTQSQLKLMLHYNPSTGIFTRLIKIRQYPIGSIAGYTCTTHGYCFVGIIDVGEMYKALFFEFSYTIVIP